jgi:hypothetical protein
VAEQHSHCPSAKTKLAMLHTCAASARCKAIPCPRAAALLRNKKTILVRLAALLLGGRGGVYKDISPKFGFGISNLNTV